MRTESERWRERDGEKRVGPTESDGTDVERRETDKEAKTGIKTDSKKIRGRERQRDKHNIGLHWLQVSLSVSAPLFGGYKWTD